MMKKFFPVIIVTVFCLGPINAQNLGERLEALAMAKHDTTRANIMASLCQYYKWNNPDSSIYYGNKAIAIARQIHYPKAELNDTVQQFATKLSEETSGESISRTKQLIGQIQQMKTEEALQFAAEMNAKARETKDFKDGITAFLNKEQKNW